MSTKRYIIKLSPVNEYSENTRRKWDDTLVETSSDLNNRTVNTCTIVRKNDSPLSSDTRVGTSVFLNSECLIPVNPLISTTVKTEEIIL